MNKIRAQQWLLLTIFFCFIQHVLTIEASATEVNAISIPIQITPESVKALIDNKSSFILINADEEIPKQLDQTTGISKIYYSLGISKTNAIKAVSQDRLLKKVQSQVLVGTPLTWQHLNIPFSQNVIPREVLKVSPKVLSDAIKDNEDILIIDLRDNSTQKDIKNNLFMGNSIHLLPHQVKEELKNISKLRWTVLVDDGYGVARVQAEELRNAGYVLVGVLDGGYPAWAKDTTK